MSCRGRRPTRLPGGLGQDGTAHTRTETLSRSCPFVVVDARAPGMHFVCVNKQKKAKPSDDAVTPGTVMAAKIRARANKLTDSEREALMGDAMRIIYGSKGDAVRAHRR